MSISQNETRPPDTVVISLGNPLMGDDGLGLAALEHLRRGWYVPPDVELVDGGTWGITLLPVIEDAKRVLFLDAIDANATPGTEIVLIGTQLPRYLATKISSHQVDLRDVLALAELRGTFPEQAVAFGLQPARVELIEELSDVVRARMGGLVQAAVRQLGEWGHACLPKTSG